MQINSSYLVSTKEPLLKHSFNVAKKFIQRTSPAYLVAAGALGLLATLGCIYLYRNWNKRNVVPIAVDNDLYENETTQALAKQMRQSQTCETKLGTPKSGSWRRAQLEQESFQTFRKYTEECGNRFSRELHVVTLGPYSDTDKQVLEITLDFINVFHQVNSQLQSPSLDLEELKIKRIDSLKLHQARFPESDFPVRETNRLNGDEFPRKRGMVIQYNAYPILRILQDRNLVGQESVEKYLIAFTKLDLFADRLDNFIFGLASYGGVGIWSSARFGDPTTSDKSFDNYLIRVMKISAHEFGHMRGISHCTDYKCNIGGYMSLKELDQRPLLYCSEDSAKICHASQITMSDYYQKLLEFLEGFNQKYQRKCNFSGEIQTLRARIKKINTAENSKQS